MIYMTDSSKKEDKMLIEDCEKKAPGLWGPHGVLLSNKLGGHHVHIFEIIFHDVHKIQSAQSSGEPFYFRITAHTYLKPVYIVLLRSFPHKEPRRCLHKFMTPG